MITTFVILAAGITLGLVISTFKVVSKAIAQVAQGAKDGAEAAVAKQREREAAAKSDSMPFPRSVNQ